MANKYIEFNYQSFGLIEKEKKYLLLVYFLGGTYPLSEMYHEMAQVQGGEATFEEIYDDTAELAIGHNAGVLEYDKQTAYFISDTPESPLEPSFEMPLKDLMDVIEEWLEHKSTKRFKNEVG